MKKPHILLACLLMIACGHPKKASVATESTGELPEFIMTLTTGEQLMSNTLPGNLILVFYNPDCDHCQREAKAIRKEIDKFSNHQVYFIAASPMETITQFSTDYDLAGFPNVVFAKAEVPDVVREMGPMGSPAVFIYSRDKQLVKKFDGETNVEEIIKFL